MTLSFILFANLLLIYFLKDEIQFLTVHTTFTKEQIQDWHKRFLVKFNVNSLEIHLIIRLIFILVGLSKGRTR